MTLSRAFTLVVLLAGIAALGYVFTRRDQPVVRSVTPGIAYYNSEEHTKLSLPFSEAVRAGDLVYTAVVGNVPGTLKLAEGGIEGETKQAMANLERILKANGSSLDRVVKCTVLMTDMREWPAMNAAYATFFQPGRYPARAAYGVTALAIGARIEIDCVALAAPSER